MESRRPLYDPRNTVTLSRPSKRNQERRRRILNTPAQTLKLMPPEQKVAMTSICRWCNRDQLAQRAICRFCHTCQYCGLVPTGSRHCDLCGNEDLDYQPGSRRVVVGQEPRKTKKGPHTRLDAQRRRRAEHLRLRG